MMPTQMPTRNALRLAAVTVLAAATLAALPAEAVPLLRQRVDQRGDFVIFGNTVAHECDAGVPAPVVGTVGACGMNVAESSPDVHWRADEPAGGATASTMITPAMARSTAVLRLPAGATVSYARLYWSSVRSGALPDGTVLLDRPGVGAFSSPVAATASSIATSVGPPAHTYYQSSADVTALVLASGPGAYRVSDIDSIVLANLDDNHVYVAWTMVVFYRLDTDPPRNLTLFDGLDLIEPATPQVTVSLSGFLVPNAGFDARLAVVAYEGDGDADGDRLAFNGTQLFNAANPVDNFFNSSRTFLGALVSNPGDLPQLTGGPRSMSGYDQDVVDVSSLLARGDTSATVQASTSGEFFVLGAFVTSIATFRPDFSSTGKSFVNLTRNDGAVRPGDVLEYTITTRNDGNDPGVGVTLTDALPAGITLVPGSIRIASGTNAGAKTDAAGDDQAEYVAGTRTVTVRLGVGAGAAQGGTVAAGEVNTVVFRVTIDANATGTIANQAVVSAAGMSGAPSATFPSDGNGIMPGTPPTMTPIDQCLTAADCMGGRMCNTAAHPFTCVECRTSADCTNAQKPICDTAMGVCRACATDADCPMATPACHASGRCVECLPTSMARCTGATPVCHPGLNVCAGCRTSADCTAASPVCDDATRTCRGCRTDPECPATAPACQPGGTCGECSATNKTRCVAPRLTCDLVMGKCIGGCATNADCAGATPLCAAGTCVPCMADGAPSCPDARFPACQKMGPLAGWCTECSATNTTRCGDGKPQCLADLGICGCSDRDGDSECGALTSGIVCNGAAGICIPGCAAAPRNGCPMGQTCTSTTAVLGSCAVGMCTSDANCALPLPKCDLAAAAPRCVQCLVDADCKGGFVCNPSRVCVECIPGRPDGCANASAGGRCLPTSTCGCQADGDCLGARSGRICNTGIMKCTVSVPAPDAGAPDGRDAAAATDGAVAADASPRDAATTPDAPSSTADAPAPVTDTRAAGDTTTAAGDTAPPSQADATVAVADSYLAGGGCKCNLGERGSPAAAWPVLLLGAALLLRRRRRR